MTNTQTHTLVPNSDRVILKYLNISTQLKSGSLLVAGQLKAGENLLCGVIVEGGSTKFKAHQLVYYSEYSASKLVNAGKVIREDSGFAGLQKFENEYYVVAEDDIMAYEVEPDSNIVPKESTTSYEKPAFLQDVPDFQKK